MSSTTLDTPLTEPGGSTDAFSDALDSKTLKRLARRGELFFAVGLVLFVCALYALGRIYWDERYYVAEEGLGYGLGLTGGIMMLCAYVYGLFKHVSWLRSKGMMRWWLRVHIFFGITGPILVLLHSTFRIGSLNGGVALFTMLLVFLSGIIGRYLYSKIHYGLGGQKARMDDMQQSLVAVGKRIKSRRLETFTEKVMQHPESLLGAYWDLLTFGWRSRWLSLQLRRDMRRHLTAMAKERQWPRRELRRHRRDFRRQLAAYMLMLRKVALFSVYERFFAFWRHAHVPLLYLLFMSGVAHVVAVHMY
jgi:hypothetical protein